MEDPELSRLKRAAKYSIEPCMLPDSRSNGVGKFRVEPQFSDPLVRLHNIIASKLTGVTWGEGESSSDPRQRMYGFLPGKLRLLVNSGIRIQKEGAEDDIEHQQAIETSVLNLHFFDFDESKPYDSSRSLSLGRDMYDALSCLTSKVHALVPENYKEYVTMEGLVAVQPNLHNGASYLPLHLDFPRNDGFGIVIATFAVKGSGLIVLQDDGDEGQDEQFWSFPLDESECYILCGDTRNKCVHGVISEDHPHRETLNLRYGLHSERFAYDEVSQHWPE